MRSSSTSTTGEILDALDFRQMPVGFGVRASMCWRYSPSACPRVTALGGEDVVLDALHVGGRSASVWPWRAAASLRACVS